LVRKRRRLPSVGELVIGTVEKIFDQGAYVSLDEYGGLTAYVPAGEITRTWFRSIREVLREGQKQVFKVIRVDPRKGHVDLSLRRVSEGERKDKLFEWKRAQKAEKFLELAANKLGKTLDDAYREAGWKMEDYFGEIFAGFEAAAERGEKVLLEAGLRPEWARVVYEVAKDHIEVPKVKLIGILKLTCLKPKGVEVIRNSLLKAKEYLSREKEIEFRIYTIGAPRYRIEVITRDPKRGEELLKRAAYVAIEEVRRQGGEGSFEREKH